MAGAPFAMTTPKDKRKLPTRVKPENLISCLYRGSYTPIGEFWLIRLWLVIRATFMND
jgi:hypothetical protein